VLLYYKESPLNLGKCSQHSDFAMGCTVQGSDPARCKRFVSSLKCPDLLWNPSTLLCCGYWEPFSQGQSDWGMSLTTFSIEYQGWDWVELYFTPPVCLHELYRDLGSHLFPLMEEFSPMPHLDHSWQCIKYMHLFNGKESRFKEDLNISFVVGHTFFLFWFPCVCY
jgi:hypothetical protein